VVTTLGAGGATSARAGAVAATDRAARTGVLVTGLAGSFALARLVAPPTLLVLTVLAAAAGAQRLGHPLRPAVRAPAGAAGRGSATGARDARQQARQATSLALILVAVVLCFYLGRQADVTTRVSTLGLVLLVLQLAYAISFANRREAVVACGVAIAMLAVGATGGWEAWMVIPAIAVLLGTTSTLALVRRATELESSDAISVGAAASTVRRNLAPAALAFGMALATFLAMPPLGNANRAAGQGASAAGEGDRGGAAAAPQRSVSLLSPTRLDLRARGALPNAAVLSVPADAPEYWAGAIYASFDGTGWNAAPALVPWTVTRDGSATVQRPPGASGPAAGRTDTVIVLGGAPLDTLYAPGPVTEYAGPGRAVSDATGAVRLSAADGPTPLEYRVTSTPISADAAALQAASGPDPADPSWTSLPPTIAPRVTALAANLTAGATTRADAVDAIENYLRSNEKYDLNSPEPARGDDAVDDFVFVSHRGFCEQFATAAVVMLRAVGIPARLVTGYAFGDTTSTPGRRVFHGDQAHAWVQAYFPGIGWVTSDPTATATLARPPAPSLTHRVASALGDAARHLPAGRLARAGLVLLVAGAGAGAVAAIARRRRRRRHRTQLAPPGEQPVLAAFLRLERALADDPRGRAPGETLAEFGRRLGGMAAAPHDVAAAMRCLERECYAHGRRGPDAAETAAAVALFDRLRAAASSEPVVVSRTRA
jgi:transglutaminase-like putative cysteine protease